LAPFSSHSHRSPIAVEHGASVFTLDQDFLRIARITGRVLYRFRPLKPAIFLNQLQETWKANLGSIVRVALQIWNEFKDALAATRMTGVFWLVRLIELL